MGIILNARGIYKTFISVNHFTGTKHEKQALKDFAISLPEGGIVALVGESGSGKTTAA